MNISPFSKGDKVVAYCRYSEGDDQGLKNTSTEEQEAAIRKFCDENGITVVKVFADPFASGRSVAKRDKYLEMMSYLTHGKKKQDIQGVILWDYERFGRDMNRAQYDAAQLRMKGYKLFSMQQPVMDTSPFSGVMEAMFFASAQNQSDMISADVKRALQSNFTKYKVIPRTNIPDGWLAVPVKMGYYTDGRERIGYRAEPDPDYVEKIREAIEDRLRGASTREMREKIGGKFADLPIKIITLMQKPLLYGAMTYGGTTIENYCKPIIDKATFDRLQIYNAAMPKRRRSPGAGVYALNRSLLSGLLVCGECGEHMHLDSRKAKGHLYETYYCNSYHIGIRREAIEDVIVKKAIELLTGDEWDKSMDELLPVVANPDQLAEDEKKLEKELRETDRKLKRLLDALLVSDNPPEILVSTMTDLESRKKEILKSLENTEQKTDRILKTAEDFRSRILSVLMDDLASTDEKRDALAVLIPEIIVYRHDRQSCKLIIKHGLPGYSQVADNSRQNDLRPSNYCSNTCNLLMTTIYIKKSGFPRS